MRAMMLAPVVCFLIAGGLGGWALVPMPEVQAAPPVEITVAGMRLPEGGDAHAAAAGLARAWLRERVTVRTPSEPVVRTRAGLGARVDVEHLAKLIEQARDARSVMRRLHAQARGGEPLELPMPFDIDPAPALELLVEIKDAHDRAAVEARMDTATRTMKRERAGLRVDAWETIRRLDQALERGRTTVDVVVDRLRPHRTAASLGHVAMDAVLGEFSTKYNPLEEARDRTHNLRVAAARIDGMVLLPGEVFDYNQVVGERTEANGFRPAPVIAGGELVDGVGGGACQVAGTLHAAVFFAGLEIVERHPHSRPSFYIKLGLDAAVAYPTLNFRFQNSFDFPIVIGFTIESGDARAVLYGARREPLVTFVRHIVEVTPFEERTAQDGTLPAGVRVLSQRGVPGFEVKRWRIRRFQDRNQAFREAMEDTYPPTTQIVRVGTGGPAPDGYVRPADDDHAEYVADEFLSLTQGPGVEGLLEQKRAGRTGTPGWTRSLRR